MLDPALIDLFRSEVETHSDALNAALLDLERHPGDTSRVDEMMRAAHSIKGASRVVGVEPAIRVAHVMEDCFVAAQKGKLSLTSADVDILLRGVDLLGNIGTAAGTSPNDLNAEFASEVERIVQELEAMLQRPGSSATNSRPPAPASATHRSRQITLAAPASLNATTAEELRRQLVSAIESDCERVAIDLSLTQDLDVHGLAFLAAIPAFLTSRPQISLELAKISEVMRTVLRVTGLEAAYLRQVPPVKGTN